VSDSSEEKQESIFDQESLILDSCGGSVYSYMNLKSRLEKVFVKTVKVRVLTKSWGF
jgi:hypothetical protein